MSENHWPSFLESLQVRQGPAKYSLLLTTAAIFTG